MHSYLEQIIPHPAWIEIDLIQFKKNLQAVRKRIGKSLFCLCVKADAYGHGISEIGMAAEEAGVDYLCVACLKEGIELRLKGVSLPILVLGAIHEDQIQSLIEWNLEFTLSSKYKADLVLDVCSRLRKKCRVHLEVDTGMRRTGVRVETAIDLLPWLLAQTGFTLVGVYSHFATADLPNNPFAFEQIREFQKLKECFKEKNLIWHLANSGGVAFYPDSHFDMVRPGLLCYGYFPDGSEDRSCEIAPCFSLKAKVSYFKVVEADIGISYGHSYKTDVKTRVVTVPIGYGDGYRRAFSNKGFVLIREQKYKIAGVVCMDQFMVDIGMNEVYIGDEVTLIGRQGMQQISLEEAALIADTVPYELLCCLNGRLSRIYI
jgi:alanine racemase